MALSRSDLPINIDLEIWGGHGIGTVVELFHSQKTTAEYVNLDRELSAIRPYFTGMSLSYEPPYQSHFPAPDPFLEITLAFGRDIDIREVSIWLQRNLDSVGIQSVDIQDPREESDIDSIMVEVNETELEYYLAMVVKYEIQATG